MEKRILLALTILINLHIVYAQEEEKILGMSISSLLIILPVAMLIIGLLFFLGLYLKDHYKDIAQLFKFKRRKAREVRKKIIDYPKEVRNLQGRLPSLEPKEAVQQLSGLAKKFFAEKFNIDYEFTHGELEKELKKEKEEWAGFPKKLSDLKYSGEPLSRNEARAIVKEFWDIVKYEKKKRISLTVVEELKKRRLVFEIKLLKNLKHYLQKAKPKGKEKLTSIDVMKYFIKRQKHNLSILVNIFKKVKTDTVTEIKTQLAVIEKVRQYFLNKLSEKRIDQLLSLIEESHRQIIKGRVEQAKKLYKQAYKLYYHVPIEEQVPIITELQKLQEKIIQYKPTKITKATPIDQVKNYMEERLIRQKINKTKDIIEEAQKQITKGRVEQAKKLYKQAYKLYYNLPIEEQVHALTELQNIQQSIIQYKQPKQKEKAIGEIKRTEQELTKQGVTKIDELVSGTQKQITTELQDIQKKIKGYQKIPKKTTETIINQVKNYMEERLIRQKINKTKDIIEEAQEQITKGRTNQAKKAYQQAYKLYYNLPIEEQTLALSRLRKIKDQIDNVEKNAEKTELEELSKELNKLRSEGDVYVIMDKSDVSKKLDFLTKYVKQVEAQGIHGLKAGKTHLKDKLKEITKSAKELERKKLTPREKSFVARIKEFGMFYPKKEEALEKAFKKKQKQLFSQLHHITKQVRIVLHPKTKKKIAIKHILKPELKPQAPPKYIEGKDVKVLRNIERLLSYLKKKEREGLYRLSPVGKEFLGKLEAMLNTVKERKQKGIAMLRQHEKEFLKSLALLMRIKEEKAIPAEEEKRMLEFLEHMKEERMIQTEKEKLQKEIEILKEPSLIEAPKVKANIERLKRLAKEEETIMDKLQKIPKTYPTPVQRIQKKRLERYNWEITADEVRRKKTKEMVNLLKEEEKVMSKLDQLEEGFSA